jgi:hypothetical protein
MLVSLVTVFSEDTTEHPKLASLYREGLGMEISAWVAAELETCDYGVPGSPVWEELADVRVIKYEINGVIYTPKEAEAQFGQEIEAVLWDVLTEEATERGDWE